MNLLKYGKYKPSILTKLPCFTAWYAEKVINSMEVVFTEATIVRGFLLSSCTENMSISYFLGCLAKQSTLFLFVSGKSNCYSRCYHPRCDKHSSFTIRLQVQYLIIETIFQFSLQTFICHTYSLLRRVLFPYLESRFCWKTQMKSVLRHNTI